MAPARPRARISALAGGSTVASTPSISVNGWDHWRNALRAASFSTGQAPTASANGGSLHLTFSKIGCCGLKNRSDPITSSATKKSADFGNIEIGRVDEFLERQLTCDAP